jgi:uracil-DNA glycosylase family 4
METIEHYCTDPEAFPFDKKMFKRGEGRGARVLLVGHRPAANGCRKSGEALFRAPDGQMIRSGENLNALLEPVGLSLENCAYTDLVKCYMVGDNLPPSKCVRGCWPIFERQLGIEDFGLLILLGPPVWDVISKKAWTFLLSMGKLTRVKLSGSPYTVLPLHHPQHSYRDSGPKNRRAIEDVGDELRTMLTKLEGPSASNNSGSRPYSPYVLEG